MMLADVPSRWLVLYDRADADSCAWAEFYRSTWSLPFCNLLGLEDMPGTESADSSVLADIIDQIAGYLALNGLEHIRGILIGHNLPGVIDVSGTDYALSSLLADLDVATPDAANPWYQAGLIDTADLPDRDGLVDATRYMTAEINASSLAYARGLTTNALARSTTTPDGRVLSTLVPGTDKLAIDAFSSFAGTLVQQQMRLPKVATWDGTHGHSIEMTDRVSGAFSVAGQNKLALITTGSGTADAAVSGTGLVKLAIDAGYAVVAGHVGTSSTAQHINPAAWIAALRAGWCLAEALAIASPKINSTLRVIGDPLAYLPLPLQGYHLYSQPTRTSSTASLLAIAPAGAAWTLTGLPANSLRYVFMRAVSKLGREDVDAKKLRRVEMDGDGLLMPPVPNPPIRLRLIPTSGGGMTATWSTLTHGEEVAASSWHVYVATDTDAFDFGSIDHTLSVGTTTQALGTFADGQAVRVIVRAASAAGDEESNVAEAAAIADASAPASPQRLEVTVV